MSAAHTENGDVKSTPTAPNDRIKATMSVGNLLAGASAEGSTETSTECFAAILSPQAKAEASDISSPPVTEISMADESSEYADDNAEEADSNDNTGDDVPREFVCMNDEHSQCKTGQYTLDLSRKVISNHFGRNKACTRLIKDWPLFCRKHYQRATYQPKLWQRRKIALILRQLTKIDELFPGTTYDVGLKKSEEDRLNAYAHKFMETRDPKLAAAGLAPNDKVKSFQAPIEVLVELKDRLGRGKGVDHVRGTCMLILDMLKMDETKEVPSIEFLPVFPKIKTKTTDKSKTSRVSTKGAIQKTSKGKAQK